jgi:hypothetical protein
MLSARFQLADKYVELEKQLGDIKPAHEDENRYSVTFCARPPIVPLHEIVTLVLPTEATVPPKIIERIKPKRISAQLRNLDINTKSLPVELGQEN